MSLPKILITAVSIATLSATICSAGSVVGGEIPSNDYGAVAAKLMGAGYTEIRLVNQELHHIVAFDDDGSEVLLVVEPSTRRILSKSYIHPSDQ